MLSHASTPKFGASDHSFTHLAKDLLLSSSQSNIFDCGSFSFSERMSRHALRSTLSRVRPEIEHNCLPHTTYFRQFSSTPSQWDESSPSGTPNHPPKPSFRQRAQGASNEVSSLVRRGRGGGGGGNGANSSRGNRFAGLARGGSGSNTLKDSDGTPRVLDVRSLPTGFRGRGGLRGRGGFRGSGRRPQPGDRQRGSSNNRGKSRREGTSRGGPRNDDPDDGGKEAAEMELLAEEAFQRAMRQGERTVFNPDVSLQDLQAYMPTFASGAAGRKATIMENLAQLGTNDGVNAPGELQPSTYAEELKRDGLVFFAELREREYTEKYLQEEKQREADLAEAKAFFSNENAEVPPKEIPAEEEEEGKKSSQDVKAQHDPAKGQQQQQLIGNVEDSVKKVIFDRAISGLYEQPKAPSGPKELARAHNLLSGTYTMANVNAFAKKLDSLLSKGPAAAAAGRGGGGGGSGGGAAKKGGQQESRGKQKNKVSA